MSSDEAALRAVLALLRQAPRSSGACAWGAARAREQEFHQLRADRVHSAAGVDRGCRPRRPCPNDHSCATPSTGHRGRFTVGRPPGGAS